MMKRVKMHPGRSAAFPSGNITHGGEGWLSADDADKVVERKCGTIVGDPMTFEEWRQGVVVVFASARRIGNVEVAELMTREDIAKSVKALYERGVSPEQASNRLVRDFGYDDSRDGHTGAKMADRVAKARGEFEQARAGYDAAVKGEEETATSLRLATSAIESHVFEEGKPTIAETREAIERNAEQVGAAAAELDKAKAHAVKVRKYKAGKELIEQADASVKSAQSKAEQLGKEQSELEHTLDAMVNGAEKLVPDGFTVSLGSIRAEHDKDVKALEQARGKLEEKRKAFSAAGGNTDE